MFTEVYSSAMYHMLMPGTVNGYQWIFDADIDFGHLARPWISSLSAFWPGMQALMGTRAIRKQEIYILAFLHVDTRGVSGSTFKLTYGSIKTWFVKSLVLFLIGLYCCRSRRACAKSACELHKHLLGFWGAA